MNYEMFNDRAISVSGVTDIMYKLRNHSEFTVNVDDVTTLNATTLSSSSPQADPEFNVLQAVIISNFFLLIIVGTVVGNGLVCTAVAVTRKLRAPPSNLLIVSLAVADLLVALLDMPFAAVYEIQGHWLFGDVMCDVWTSLDVFLCTASILNLCMISVDRYLVITRPFQYAMKRTPVRMFFMITSVWLISAIISIPPLFYSKRTQPPPLSVIAPVTPSAKQINALDTQINSSSQCILNQDIGYQLYATIGAFYLPLSVMIVIYSKIYHVSAHIAKADKSKVCYVQPSSSSPHDLRALMDGRHMSLTPTAGSTTTLQRDSTMAADRRITVTGLFQALPSKRSRGASLGELIPRKIRAVCANGLSRVAGSSASERKATKTLGVIMGAFVICWLPFFVLALIKPFCADPSSCIPAWLSSLFLWLGFANSFLNPIIYARFNRDFRTPFKYILQCKCSTINSRMRNEEYTIQFGTLGEARESTMTNGGVPAENIIHRPEVRPASC